MEVASGQALVGLMSVSVGGHGEPREDSEQGQAAVQTLC